MLVNAGVSAHVIILGGIVQGIVRHSDTGEFCLCSPILYRGFVLPTHGEHHMNIQLRESQASDIPFLRAMLYEAVFWRPNPTKPSLEEGLAAPGVRNALEHWGERAGDTAVIARVDARSAGAAWYRVYTAANAIRGYLEPAIPVVVIAVHHDYRQRDIGRKMLHWLILHASQSHIDTLSLMVSKDNHARALYRQCGFLDHTDTGDSVVMVRTISPSCDNPVYGAPSDIA